MLEGVNFVYKSQCCCPEYPYQMPESRTEATNLSGQKMPQPKQICHSLLENLIYLRTQFSGSMDLIVREFKIAETDAALISIDNLVDKQTIAQSILNPIRRVNLRKTEGYALMCHLRDDVLTTVDQEQINDFENMFVKLMSGFAMLAIDGCNFVLSIGVQSFAYRSISEPMNEVVQKGSRESFVEPYVINISMIRRRMKSTNLVFERLQINSESKTDVCLCYLKDRVSPKVLSRLKQNLHKIRMQTVMDSGYLAPFIERHSLFNSVGISERPDTVCGKISEGRIAILIDGTPNALIVPHLFIENFQSFDDYSTRPFFATFTRWLKVFAFFLAIFLPGFYVASCTFHLEFLPQVLLDKILQSQAETPFSVMVECLLVHFIYEILREAGLRVPKPLGQIISIVGGLVIGDAAVQSGLVGSPTLMMIALTAISSYVAPTLYEQTALLRLLFIAIGGILGFWGITLGFCAVLLNICTVSVYNIPFSAPVSPFSFKSMRDVAVRASWKILHKNVETVQNMPGSHADRKGGGKE